MRRVLVTGGSGFIGQHLIAALQANGDWVRSVDLVRPVHRVASPDDEYYLDLRSDAAARLAVNDIEVVYHLAADMGGMGWITHNEFDLRAHNTLIDLNTVRAAVAAGVSQFFFASSACVYNEQKQAQADAPALMESDAYPAQPDLAYGWAKLWTEQLLAEAAKVSPMRVSIARFHNVYGAPGTYNGGKEKAPAALCRKIATAKVRDETYIRVWGNGQQVRSYMHVNDCVEGIQRLVASGYPHPLNLGRDDAISVDGLAHLIMDIAGADLTIEHDLTKPQGVFWRNSDNTRLWQVLGWQPGIGLREGLTSTYRWIEQQVQTAFEVSVSLT